MKKRGLILAILLIFAVNGLVLGGVVYNRSGSPESEMTLSDREFHVPYRYKSRDENSGVTLGFDWNKNNHSWDWFDRKKLEELGFKVSDFRDEAEIYRKTMLPKKVFAVLELDGAARARYLEEKRKELEKAERDFRLGHTKKNAVDFAKKQYETAMTSESRLFIVDAGFDPQRLRKKYPDRSVYLILPAEVRANLRRWGPGKADEEGKPKFTGRVSKLLPGKVHVPRRFHSLIYDSRGSSINSPKNPVRFREKENSFRFEAVLKTGTRYEAWIAEMRTREGG